MVQERPLEAGSKLFCPKESSSSMLGCWLIPLEDCGVCTESGSRDGPQGRLRLSRGQR